MFLILEVFLISYLIGSIPTAYIAVRRKSHIDIRSAGSGNVGTMNAYEVTGSRIVGVAVLFVDAAKGAGAILFTMRFLGHSEDAMAASLIGVVVGHCFPIWLKFKGGRGLAAAAGGMLVLDWPFVLVWLVCWIIGYSIIKDVHFGNIVAIVAAPILGWMMPQEILLRYLAGPFSSTEFLAVYSLVSAILFIRHIKPIRQLFWPSINNGN